VRVHVEVPTSLTPEQRAKLEEFAIASGDNRPNSNKGLFEKAKKMFD